MCFRSNGSCGGVACLIQLHIFCVSFRKNLTSLHLKILISHDWGSCWDFWHLPCIYYVFRERWLCWCRLFSSLFHFFCLLKKNLSYMHLKTFISHDWGSCWHCQHLFFVALSLGNGSCASVTERRQLHIFFALCLPACGSLCDFRPHLYVSFVGLYALWLVFNTVSAYIFKAAFYCAG